ncbi:hypothetical protein PIB30_003930 [Stylosanthes scabra]|uniref:Uncharacterized protein n=1 Tax=Stylosanthes scabra TaxID=79078 RepID=A0ABU6V283_9FABA|nr:hypothetical protein [Stylosanthes scabra]
MQQSKPVSTPMLSTQKLMANTGTPFDNPTLYRSIVGGSNMQPLQDLILLTLLTDLASSWQILALNTGWLLKEYSGIYQIGLQIQTTDDLPQASVYSLVQTLYPGSARSRTRSAEAPLRRNIAHSLLPSPKSSGSRTSSLNSDNPADSPQRSFVTIFQPSTSLIIRYPYSYDRASGRHSHETAAYASVKKVQGQTSASFEIVVVFYLTLTAPPSVTVCKTIVAVLKSLEAIVSFAGSKP